MAFSSRASRLRGRAADGRRNIGQGHAEYVGQRVGRVGRQQQDSTVRLESSQRQRRRRRARGLSHAPLASEQDQARAGARHGRQRVPTGGIRDRHAATCRADAGPTLHGHGGSGDFASDLCKGRSLRGSAGARRRQSGESVAGAAADRRARRVRGYGRPSHQPHRPAGGGVRWLTIISRSGMPALDSAAAASAVSSTAIDSGSVTHETWTARAIAQERVQIATVAIETLDERVVCIGRPAAAQRLHHIIRCFSCITSKTPAIARSDSGIVNRRRVCPVGAVSTTMRS